LRRFFSAGKLEGVSGRASKKFALLGVAVFILFGGCATSSKKGAQAGFDRIAHIRHADLIFSVRIERDQHGKAFLRVAVPYKFEFGKTITAKVWAKVKMRDESVVEGNLPVTGLALANAGWANPIHRLQLRDGTTMRDVFSVTLSINGENYELYTF
jgi:hypothetical protein